MALIDLSHPISPSTPVYPGTEPPRVEKACTLEKDGFVEHRLTFFTHTGTHMDAPAHMLAGAPTLDMLPTDHFYGTAVVLDFAEPSRRNITPDDLEPHREQIAHSAFVLLHTDWDRLWGRDEYFRDFPVLTPEAAAWITRFPLHGVGVDAISVDAVGSTEYPVHHTLLGRGMVIIENLTNLSGLVGQAFTFVCLPLPLVGADGSPVRAAAVVDV